jgi:dTDP-4-dehydrorhamnose 3,5-epimerase-like enzyme|tara:strand:+ start:11272 stop:11658 length:387 start_codon:yes stop_codon:yes gene_type:complete
MINLKTCHSPKGNLATAEFKDLPFFPKRFFIVSNVPAGEIRGGHAHRKDEQLLLCHQGKIIIKNENKKETKTYELTPNTAVLLEKLTWSTQTYVEEDSILISFCSEEFNENEYIRDRDEFNRILNKDE